jgi:hypothetical protein
MLCALLVYDLAVARGALGPAPMAAPAPAPRPPAPVYAAPPTPHPRSLALVAVPQIAPVAPLGPAARAKKLLLGVAGALVPAAAKALRRALRPFRALARLLERRRRALLL